MLLGVSGGADSVVMADLFNRLRHDLSLSLHIAHFNHKLRKTSGRDQTCVEALAKRLNIPHIVGCRKPKGRGPFSEDQCRQWRFEFFVKSIKQVQADALVLAHTRNDLAETVLMRIIRGSGMYGLRGILPKRRIMGMDVIRPLITTTRAEVETYAHRQNLKFCTDESNTENRFLRNKIRLQLLPLLARNYNPNIVSTLADLANTTTEDYEFLKTAAFKGVKESVVISKGKVKIRFNFLQEKPPAVRRLLLRYAFEQLTGGMQQITLANIKEAEDLLEYRPVGARVHWPQSVNLKRSNRYLEIYL